MKLLKKENWWIWLLVAIFSSGAGYISLAALLDVFDENAWYAKWQNWLLGLVLFIFPITIMAIIFILQMTCLVAAKLEVPGKEIYLSPYIWILCLIIPIIGWVFLCVMALYLEIWILVMLSRGKGESIEI